MGSDGVHGIGGPYEPRISPDGKRFANYFYVETSFDDLEHNIRWIDTGSYRPGADARRGRPRRREVQDRAVTPLASRRAASSPSSRPSSGV